MSLVVSSSSLPVFHCQCIFKRHYVDTLPLDSNTPILNILFLKIVYFCLCLCLCFHPTPNDLFVWGCFACWASKEFCRLMETIIDGVKFNAIFSFRKSLSSCMYSAYSCGLPFFLFPRTMFPIRLLSTLTKIAISYSLSDRSVYIFRFFFNLVQIFNVCFEILYRQAHQNAIGSMIRPWKMRCVDTNTILQMEWMNGKCEKSK